MCAVYSGPDGYRTARDRMFNRHPDEHVHTLTRFIVNADDLGASESINDAIFAAIDEGVVTSATLMATGAAFASAARRASTFPAASFGIHLNLTQYRPLTRDPALLPLLGTDGDFRHGAVFEARWSPSLMSAVVTEWVAQVNVARAAGIRVSHLDSHLHVHTLPWLFPALKLVQWETRIRRVRGTLSVFDAPSEYSRRRMIAKRLWRAAMQVGPGTRMTDELADFLTFQRAISNRTYAPSRWPRTIELMVHPTANVDYSGLEAQVLRTRWLEALPVRGTLISYEAL